ncbi:helix-turn-helix transcriptional regulator [Granulicella mallensis]|uniref:helix-turn-helix domain-containing protein n=1 Tax=Granulicella mallensis TaxID=940614 RepID=UPI001612FC5B|nr:helix-turn-helix transcriptional regulator [Granulicella mallensis]
MALERSRKERGFTQEETAKLLGVSQPFLSQMENGQRPVQEAVATRAFELLGEPTLLPLDPNRRQDETSLANELGALGYPGLAPFAGQPSRNPAELLLDALDRPDLDTRVAEGLPWLALRYPDLDWDWLLSETKLRNRQNRLGFVVGLAQQIAHRSQGLNKSQSKLNVVEVELEKARLANPDTYCHDSWSQRQRDQTNKRRSDLAEHWNLTTGVKVEHLDHYSS